MGAPHWKFLTWPEQLETLSDEELSTLRNEVYSARPLGGERTLLEHAKFLVMQERSYRHTQRLLAESTQEAVETHYSSLERLED